MAEPTEPFKFKKAQISYYSNHYQFKDQSPTQSHKRVQCSMQINETQMVKTQNDRQRVPQNPRSETQKNKNRAKQSHPYRDIWIIQIMDKKIQINNK